MSNNEMDMVQIILEAGIVVKLVLISLLVASIVSWGIIFKKKKIIKELNENSKDFLDVYTNAHSLKEIYESCDRLGFSPYRSLFTHGYKELHKIKLNLKEDKEALRKHFETFGFNSLERALSQGVHEIDTEIERFLSTLASIGSVSPFIGLFGTVWGIINSFTGIAGGGATLDAVAPGIAEALVATAIGLAAAIPAVWFYNKFNNENVRIHSDMESFGQEFLNQIERTITRK